MTEAELQQQVADYLRLQYPDVLFHSDFGSGTKLTIGQAIRQKRLNGGKRAWPDMFIAEPKTVKIGETKWEDIDQDYHGLFIELKKEGVRLVKVRKPDEWASDHIAEQAETLRALRGRGYMAEFAVGFDEAKKIIDNYLGGCNHEITK